MNAENQSTARITSPCSHAFGRPPLTMNSTIATKMIVMSNELRTRGSMPGAIRSEIITRSSAWAVMNHLQSRVTAEEIYLWNARILQESCEQFRTNRERAQVDVLVHRVRAASLDAQPVKDRNAERGDQVAVRTAA